MIEEFGSSSNSNDASMICTVTDENFYVRSKHWTDDKDFVWIIEKEGGNNKFFNILSANTCSPIEPYDAPSVNRWKSSSDDIFPPFFNGTYVGGNHGYYGVNVITATAHGKTESDIGSVWLNNNTTYCLVKVIDENVLWMMPYTESSMISGDMPRSKQASGTLVHSIGATNTSDIIIETTSQTQLWRCENNYSVKLFVDGVEYDTEENNVYFGDRIEFLTEYDIIFIPAMLTYLMENVGNNTNDSQFSNDIKEFYMRLCINYQFNLNGSVSTYSSYFIGKDITGCNLGLVQAQAIGNPAYCYIPDTIHDEITISETGDTSYVSFSKKNWRDEKKAPYRYYQFNSSDCDKGMCLTYDRSIGYGNNDKRVPMIAGEAGNYNGGSKKMYPQLIQGQNLTAGTYIDGMAARVPLYKYDPDLTSVGWYWCSDDIILMIDTHNTVNKDIILPDYMNNMRVEKLDVTDSVTMEQTYIFNNKLRFQCTDYGYAVLRLYK
jgi:hypothetical protein